MSTRLSTAPRVVALMPAWNAEAFIARTLDALLAQTYQNLAILISDDDSDDGTAQICASYAAKHPQCHLLRQTKRQGWVGNVNLLLREAQGQYFFFAFHDDPPMPQYVASLVRALEQDNDASLAFSDIRLVFNDGDSWSIRAYAELDGVSDRVERACRIVQRRGLWWIPNRGLFRAEVVQRIGGLRRHIAGEYSADLPWLVHLALLGRFARVPEPLITKHWRKDGLSRSWKGSLWQTFGLATSCAHEVLRADISGVERASLLREIVIREIKGLRWTMATP